MSSYRIRLAHPLDGPQLAEIYQTYCATPVSFEEPAPDAEEMARRVSSLLPVYPWLVAEEDQQILGYAYACGHRQRAAYRWSVESTVYLRPSSQGQGMGRALYQKLLNILARQGFRTVLAGITLPNPASLRLHQSLGFQSVALYPAIGYKHGQWRTTQWLSLNLEQADQSPAETLLLSEIGEDSAQPLNIHTARLSLRPLGPGHGEVLWAFVDAERERLREGFPVTVSQVIDPASAERFARSKSIQWSRRESYSFGLWRSDGPFSGFVSLKHFDWTVPKADMGYCLARSAEGQGLMSEAIRGLLPFAFEQLGLERLYLRIHPSNVGSQRVAEKCGFRFEGLLRSDFRSQHGSCQDMQYYGLTGDDWRQSLESPHAPRPVPGP